MRCISYFLSLATSFSPLFLYFLLSLFCALSPPYFSSSHLLSYPISSSPIHLLFFVDFSLFILSLLHLFFSFFSAFFFTSSSPLPSLTRLPSYFNSSSPLLFFFFLLHCHSSSTHFPSYPISFCLVISSFFFPSPFFPSLFFSLFSIFLFVPTFFVPSFFFPTVFSVFPPGQ